MRNPKQCVLDKPPWACHEARSLVPPRPLRELYSSKTIHRVLPLESQPHHPQPACSEVASLENLQTKLSRLKLKTERNHWICFLWRPGGSDCVSLSAFSLSVTHRVYRYCDVMWCGVVASIRYVGTKTTTWVGAGEGETKLSNRRRSSAKRAIVCMIN